MEAKAALRLLGRCELQVGHEGVPIPGPKSQTVVAVAALSQTPFTDAALARLLSCEEVSIRSMRSRLPPAVKARLGKGTAKWTLRGVTVDVIELRAEAKEILLAGDAAELDALRKVLAQVAQPLLPDVSPGGLYEAKWLSGQRKELADLRVDLLTQALRLAEQHPGELSQADLRRALTELAPESAPLPTVVRRTRWSSPRDEVSNIETPDVRPLPGRDNELRVLRECFDADVPWQVIWGEAGIGKTALALAYAVRHARDYRVRWRVDAETEIGLRSGLRRLARQLGLPSADDSGLMAEEKTDDMRFISDLGDYLRGGFADPWLLIFDNVEHPSALGDVLTHLPAAGDVLVTSQYPDWSGTGARDRRLWGLQLEDAVKLAAEIAGREPDDTLAEICRVLDCHPMLLSHAAKTMSLDGVGPEVYLPRLRDGIEEAVGMWPQLDVTRRHAITTYNLAIEKASRGPNGHPGAPALMEVVSFFAPEPVGEEVLHAIVNTGLVPELADDQALALARRALLGRSLIQTYQRTESLTVHRVTQAVVRLGLSTDQIHARLAAAIAAVDRSLPSRWGADLFGRMAPLAPHIGTLIAHVDRVADPQLRVRAADLASYLGLFRRRQSEWKAAEAAHRRAVDFSREDSDRRRGALRAVWLANVMRQRGRFRDAEVVMGSALPTLRANSPEADPDVAFALTVQARILRGRGDSAPQEARIYMEDAVARLDRVSKPDPSQLSRTLNSYSVLVRQLGDYSAARDLTQRGLRLLGIGNVEEWLEDGDTTDINPLIAVHLRSIGNLWRLLGRLPDAASAHTRALAIVRDFYDSDHTDVGRCLESLGRAQRDYGDFVLALENFERAREITDYRLGRGNRHSATACVNIAATLMEMSRLDEALDAAEEAVDIYRRTYDDTWSDGGGALRNEHTAWAVAVRAEICARRGDTATAERNQREVLRLRTEKYGRQDHPLVVSSMQAVADVAAMDGRREEALALHTRVREARLAALGQWSSAYWLAQSDARLGELVADSVCAAEHLRAAEEVWSTHLAPGHPWLIAVRSKLAERSKCESASASS